MKRLFVTAALAPLALASAAYAETKITTAFTTPVKTSTAANGARDDLTIDTTGSVKPTASGAAVTLDSDNKVKNAGTIGFNNVSNATGVLALGGHTGAVTNAGVISLVEDYTPEDTDKDGDLDGPFAQGSGRYGVRVTGPGAFTGDVRNDAGGSITIKGNDSAGVSIETQLNGALVNAGTIRVTGDRSVGLSAVSVSGDVKVTGEILVQGEGAVAVSLGDVAGGVVLQNAVTATGFRTTERLSDAARAKLDADDLKVGGSAVRITGDVGKGVLIERPAADSTGATGVIAAYGSAPALALGAADRATTIGAVGTGDNAFGLINKGSIIGAGVNDGFSATALQVGQFGGGATTVTGGIYNQGSITATAYGAEVTAQGGDAVAMLINAGSIMPALRNSGTIQATLNGGSQSARTIVDQSGTLARIENTGVISAVSTAKTGSSARGSAVAIDLSANTTGAVVRQSKASETSSAPAIVGDVRFGSGADQLQLLGGTFTGNVYFGAGADWLRIDGGASFKGMLFDGDGQLDIQVRDGRLGITNIAAMQVTGLEVGQKGVLAFMIDPAHSAATHFQVNGAATFAEGAKIELSLTSLLKAPQSFELVSATDLTASGTGLSLAGAPFLYAAALKVNGGSLSADFRPKTAAELGLNRSGAQAYPAVFASLDRDQAIANAFLAQNTQAGFQSLYNQMLPDHSGASLLSAAAISNAISQAIGQALPHDGQGGVALWAQEIAFHIDQDRNQAAGFRSLGYGLAGGAEIVGEANALGLDLSYVTTEFKDRDAQVGERVVMNFAEGGLYWRLRTGSFQADARAGAGYVWFDGDRRLVGAGLSRSTKAKWNGWTVDLHAGASYALHAGRFYARPEASLDYVRLNEDGYQEKGGGPGLDLKVGSREGDLFTGQALVAFGWEFGGDAIHWAPELKLGYRQKISGTAGVTTAQFQGGSPFTLDPEAPPASGAVVRLGVKTSTEQMYFGFDAGGIIDDHTQEYDVRATIRFRF